MVAAWLALGFWSANLCAQIVPDGGTLLLSGTTNSISGDITVGTNGPFTTLVISNNVLLTNSGNGIVGYFAGANSNEVRVIGPNARWRMGSDLAVGITGKGCSMSISNGGFVDGHIGIVGYFIGGDSNRFRITGAGSVWSNRADVMVGWGGNGTTLMVDNGGVLRDQYFWLGEQGSNNVAIVTDAGSMLSNQFDLTVGDFGNNNQMVVSNGALVAGVLGYLGRASQASNNIMTVTGSGTVWSNASQLYVGLSGQRNLLQVQGGAKVFSDIGQIGGNYNGMSNSVVITGAGSIWTNRQDMYVGYNGSYGLLIVSNAGGLASSNGYVGAFVPATGNVAIVTGTASYWSNRADMVVGQLGVGNQLIASGGATLYAALNDTIGMQPGADSNSVLLADAGTRWIPGINSSLTVGSNGGYCSLILSNGASASTRVATIGYNSGTNFALITGTNSSFDSGLNTIVGFVIGGNRFAVSNGAVASCASGVLGLNATSSNNEAIVTGPGSLWSNRVDTIVGNLAGGNRLTVNAGAKLYTGGNATLGINSGVSSNVLILADAGTKWLQGINTSIYVGSNGAFNTLVISNGAVASCDVFSVGRSSGTNFCTLTGAGSFLYSDLNSIVGFTSTGNRLVLANGAVVSSASGVVCLNSTSSNNEAIVTGAGTIWSNRQDFIVGVDGAGARVSVSNAALVVAQGTVYVGENATSLNNRLIVDGGGVCATNGGGSGAINIVRGTNVLNAGLIEADSLRSTNSSGKFEFNGGRLRTRSTTINNGLGFLIGNGVNQAIFEMVGGGVHTLAGGVRIQANGQLIGNGFVSGLVTNSSGGVFAPGASLGTINVIGSLRCESGSTNIFEVNASAATNDLATATGSITYGGTLIVTNLAGTILPGTSFKLFNATVYAGSFSTLILPTLPPGQTWSNRLAIDGSIRVVPPRNLGVDVSHFQGEGGLSQSTWNQMYSEGRAFAFIKATEGLTGPDDSAMANNMNRAVSAGLRAGVYHYAHPENRATTNGAVAEADHFLSYAGNYIGPGYLRPVIDLEFTAATLTTTGLSDWVVAFANEIIAKRGPGAAPIVYCDQTFAHDELDSRMSAYDLWLRTITGADPTNTEPVPAGSYTNATGNFSNYAFWQYSGSGTAGGISPIDLDVCHNEFRPLDAYLITAIPSPVAPAIAVQPQGLSVAAGTSPGFSVTPTIDSSTPINYQWRFNGTNIGGATGQGYTRSNVQDADAGAYTVVLSNAAGSVTSVIAQLTVFSPVAIYQENFDEYGSAITVTNADTTNGFKIFFNAASPSPWDFSAIFGFDYAAVGAPTVIPPAPHSTNGTTRGLLLAVNKDTSAIVAAVNLFPTNRFFLGSFALKFDMWINWSSNTGTTEHVMFGINHSGNVTNRIGLTNSDGLFFTVDGDGGVNATSGTQRDFAPYLGGGTNAIPIIKTNGFGPAVPLGAQFDNSNAGFVSLFPSQSFPGLTTAAGSAGMRWIAVEVRQETNLVTWYMNDTLIAQYTNTTAYTNGDIMIGYSDNSASLGNPLNFAIIDNLRVETVGIDSDGNGLPDSWEVQFFGTFGVDANADADGDGASNAAEFAAGTNPTNAASAFKFAGSSYSTTDVTLQWATVGGHSYQVQILTNTTGSVTGSFVNLSPVIYVAGVGEGMTNYVHVGGGTNRAAYYRVQLVP